MYSNEAGTAQVSYSTPNLITEWWRWLTDLVMWQAEPLFDWSGVEHKTQLIKTFMMISNWKKNTFGLHCLYKNNTEL